MQGLIIIALLIVAFTLLMILNSYRNNIKLKKFIKLRWGKPPVKSRYDKIESVSAYWSDKLDNAPPKHFIDKITWNDLSMDEVFQRLNSTYSSVGAEYLYSRLHEPSFDAGELDDFEALVRKLDCTEGIRERIAFLLLKLGKNDYNNVHEFLFSPEERRLNRSFIFPLLAALPVISLLFALVDWKLAVLMLIGSSIINILVYYKSKTEFESQLESIRYITSIVLCAGKLAKLKDTDMKEYLDGIAGFYTQLKGMVKYGNHLLLKPAGELGFLLEYIKIVFMTDFVSYNRLIGIICRSNETFHKLWKEIGRLDAAISVASYRHSVEYFTTPAFADKKELTALEVYHPLLAKPVGNPVTLERNSIITGSNASGKSTYVKAIAINSILAQTIHTCLAKEFSFKPSLVITSMAVNDNVLDGESYFIAEIKSLKRILQTINADIQCLCFIDEILKGTNTIERIAASAAILKWLSEQNCLCVVASHDIELTDILRNLYDNYHFREQITDEGITFDYKIYKGWTTTRNAIRLLEFMEYPDRVVEAAQGCAENFDNTRQWQRFSENHSG